MMDETRYYRQKIESLENKVSELEDELEGYRIIFKSLSEVKSNMVKIIGLEVERMKTSVFDNVDYMDSRQIKKFDTLVKDYDILMKDFKRIVEEESEEDTNVAELISLLREGTDDE